MDSSTSNVVDHLVWTLHRYQLLDMTQLAELRTQLGPRFAEPRELAKEMLQRGWLTPFQANLLLSDRGASLLFGTYLLMERLGEGATGQVFKGRHLHMKRIVALKMLRPELLTDPEVVKRFYREVQVISQLSHPNIVHAYDAGQTERTHYLVMEYVEGTDLGELVKREGPLSVVQACDSIYQAALGLQHAHEKGLVHRDLKPSNLILATKLSGAREPAESATLAVTAAVPAGPRPSLAAGTVKILDLGLARLPRKSSNDTHTPLTLTGTGMMGTPDYLAPEQALDFHEVDIRADLYSLGCTLFYLLTGEPPFPGGTLAQKLMCHQQKSPPPLERFRSDVPAEVQAILLRLLAKQVHDRYQTPAELAEALAPYIGREPESLPADTDRTFIDRSEPPFAVPVRRRRPRWPVLAALMLLLGVVGFFLAVESQPSVPSAVETVAASVRSPADVESAALQPLLARHRRFLKDGSGNPEALRLELLALQRNFPGSAASLQAASLLHDLPSPLDQLDESSIRPENRQPFLPRETVAVIGEHRGRAWLDMTCLAVSGNGKFIAGGCPDGHIFTFDSDTLLDHWITRSNFAAINALCLSADGKITFAALKNTGAVLVHTRTENRFPTLAHPTNNLLSLALAPGEKLLAVGGDDSRVHVWERVDASAWANREPLKGHTGGVQRMAFAADGKRLASGGGDGAICLWDVDGTAIKQRPQFLKGHAGAITALSFTPDSNFLISAAQDKTLRLWSLLELKKPPSVFREERHPVTAVAVRPDGKQVALLTAFTMDIQLWTLADGEFRKQDKLSGHPGGTWAVAFLPDGKTLASTGADRRLRLWDVTAAPPQERKKVLHPEIGLGGIHRFALTPDNTLLALHGQFDTWCQFWRMGKPAPVEQPRVRCSASAGLQLAFSLDGKGLLTSDYRHMMWSLAPEPWVPAALKPGHQERLVDMALAPDGKTMASAGSEDQTIRLWDLTHGTPLVQHVIKLEEPKLQVLSLSYHPDGKTLLVVGSDHKLHLWDISGSQPQERGPPVSNLADALEGAALSADGRVLVAVGNRDRRATLWTWSAGRPLPLRSIGGEDGGGTMIVQSVAFAPDGKTIAASGYGSEAVAVWNVATGQKLRGWKLPGPVHGVDFSADGRHLITANGNGTLCVLRLEKPARAEKR